MARQKVAAPIFGGPFDVGQIFKDFWKMRTFLLSLALFVSMHAHAQERAALVGVDLVVMTKVQEELPLIANVVANQSGEISTNVAGQIQDVLVRVGDEVKKDDVLLVIDPQILKLNVELSRGQLEEAEAAVEVARASKAQAQRFYDRALKLKGSSGFSSARLEDATDALASSAAALLRAKAGLIRAQAGLELSGKNLRDGVIRAPFDGVVYQVMPITGTFVNRGQAVVVMVDKTTLELEIPLPNRYLDQVGPGSSLRFMVQGKEIISNIDRVVPREDPRTRARAVRATLEPGLDLVEGQSVQVMLVLASGEPQITMSKDALIDGPQGKIVFKVVDNVAQPTKVKVGASVNNRFVVLDGLQEGDVVVVRGNERLRPGQKVQPLDQEGGS